MEIFYEDYFDAVIVITGTDMADNEAALQRCS